MKPNGRELASISALRVANERKHNKSYMSFWYLSPFVPNGGIRTPHSSRPLIVNCLLSSAFCSVWLKSNKKFDLRFSHSRRNHSIQRFVQTWTLRRSNPEATTSQQSANGIWGYTILVAVQLLFLFPAFNKNKQRNPQKNLGIKWILTHMPLPYLLLWICSLYFVNQCCDSGL